MGMRSQILYTNRSFEIWQVRMFVKQRQTHGWSSYLPGKNIFILKQKIIKSLHHYVLNQWKRLWVCIYAHCSSMRSQMLYPNRRFEIWQVRMFVRQILAEEKYIYPKAKIVKSLHHYVLSQWKRFWVCIYVHCSSMRSQMFYPNQLFEIWQVRMFVRQILAGEKYMYPKAKIVKSLHHYVLSQWKRFWVCIYVHCSSMRSQMFYPNQRFEICQVQMFLKQPNRQLQQLLAVENKILQQLKPSLDSFQFSTWCSNLH